MIEFKEEVHGFTYVEIIVCLWIATLIVGPLSYSFLISVRTSTSAKHMEDATTFSEKLMLDIKEQMTEDIIAKGELEGRKIQINGETAKKKIKEGAGQYLLEGNARASEGINRSAEKIEALLDEDSKTLNAKYHTQQYAYEVAMWQIDDIPLSSENAFTLNDTTIDKAIKFYTDSDTKYQFDKQYYASLTNPITFEVTDKILKTSKDSDEKIADLNTIAFKEDGSFDKVYTSHTPPRIKVKLSSVIKVGGKTKGYHFIIEDGGISASLFPKEKSISIIEIDVRNLLRDANLNDLERFKDYTFKFTNQTDYNQMIRVKQNAIYPDEADAYTKERIFQAVSERFNIVADDQKAGKSTIVHTDDIETYTNYMIAILVRDKKPVQGEVGKVVKQMIDFYSYDVTVGNRRG